MSYVSVTHCSFVKKGDASKDYKSLEQMGIFNVPMYGDDNALLGCIRYDSGSEWDRNFKVVRAASAFLLFCLSLLSILHTLSVLFLSQERRKQIIHWIGRGLIFPALFFNSLLFIILGGDECKADDMQCWPGAGAILAILNEFVLVGAALLYLLVPAPTYPVYVRLSSISDVQSEYPFMERSLFSVPETIKAKNIMKEMANRSSNKSQKPARKEDPSKVTTLVVRNNNNKTATRSVNLHGSSSSTMVLDEDDVEAPPSPSRQARTYRAPSRTSNV